MRSRTPSVPSVLLKSRPASRMLPLRRGNKGTAFLSLHPFSTLLSQPVNSNVHSYTAWMSSQSFFFPPKLPWVIPGIAADVPALFQGGPENETARFLGTTAVLKQPRVLGIRLTVMSGTRHHQSTSWLRHVCSSLCVSRIHPTFFQYVG